MGRFWAVCYHCLGEGCEHCKRGTISYDDKPENVITNEAREYLKAYVYIKEYQIWPVIAGMVDQSAKLIHAIDVIDSIHQRYNEIEQAEQEAKRRVNGKR